MRLVSTGLTASEVDERSGKTYTLSKSSASCRISEIKGIIFSGLTSRFWMLRKHVNSLRTQSELDRLPFYSWDCITLQLPHRDIDLVIPCEHHMRVLLTFLVYSLKTIDGNRGSAKEALAQMNKHSKREFLQQSGREFLTKSREHAIESTNEYRLFSKVLLKYTIMKVRAKISYTSLYTR